MRTIALVDIECGGLDPAKHALLEVAVAFLDVATGKLIRAFSTLVNDTSREHGSEEVHGITRALSEHGMALEPTLAQVYARIKGADAAFAFNSQFDSQWLPGITLYDAADFPWQKASHGKSQVAIALAHGVGVSAAHRAIDDVMTLQRILERCVELGSSLEDMCAFAMRPKAEYVALASFEEKDVVKASGFHWFPEVKEWRKRCFVDDVESLPFRVKEVAA